MLMQHAHLQWLFETAAPGLPSTCTIAAIFCHVCCSSDCGCYNAILILVHALVESNINCSCLFVWSAEEIHMPSSPIISQASECRVPGIFDNLKTLHQF